MEKSWGYCKNKTESQKQEAQIQNLRMPENSWLQGTLIDKNISKSLHTYTETKLHPRDNKFQSKTYQANSPTTQEPKPVHKNIGSQKSHQTHRHLKTHSWTLLRTPEKRDPAPPTMTPMQASLTRKLWWATRPTPYKGGTSTIQRDCKLPAERPNQTQQPKQDEKAEKYSTGKGRW